MKLTELFENIEGMTTTADIAVFPSLLFKRTIKRSQKAKTRKTKKD